MLLVYPHAGFFYEGTVPSGAVDGLEHKCQVELESGLELGLELRLEWGVRFRRRALRFPRACTSFRKPARQKSERDRDPEENQACDHRLYLTPIRLEHQESLPACGRGRVG